MFRCCRETARHYILLRNVIKHKKQLTHFAKLALQMCIFRVKHVVGNSFLLFIRSRSDFEWFWIPLNDRRMNTFDFQWNQRFHTLALILHTRCPRSCQSLCIAGCSKFPAVVNLFLRIQFPFVTFWKYSHQSIDYFELFFSSQLAQLGNRILVVQCWLHFVAVLVS